ncbi:hypothetical protein [Exiguobacterium artemiae]|uniref:hypothetical protein n=1 Tax=Exiguobacterium artemiae TaxID=340145 RepID=UPI003D051F56
MYKNRSPNLIIVIVFLCSLCLPANSSRATTNKIDLEEPLTVELCRNFLEEREKDTEASEDPLLLEKKKACETLLEETKLNEPDQEGEPALPDKTTPKEQEESNEEVISPANPEKDESVTSPTPESDTPTTPEPSTSGTENPMPSDIPASEDDTPTNSNSEKSDSPLSEEEESPIAPPSSTEEKSNEQQKDYPVEKKETSPEELPVPKATKKEPVPKQQAVTPRLAGIAVLGNSSLSVTYNATTKTIQLVNDVSSLLNANLSSSYIIFRLPSEVMQSIEANSVQLQYRYSGLLGIGTRTVEVVPVIDRTNNQIYADVSSFLKLSLLSNDRFTLSFKVGQLPVGLDKTYTFKSALVDGLIDLNVLSGNTATATLGIGPTFSLTVPSTLDFGSHELTGRETIISRLEPMKISIAHENATGYNWRLQASLTRPLTSTEGDVLKDVLYFKTSTKKQLLQATEIEVANGQMTGNQNQSPLTYAKEEGIILDLTGKYATPSTYSADIQWSLVNAP